MVEGNRQGRAARIRGRWVRTEWVVGGDGNDVGWDGPGCRRAACDRCSFSTAPAAHTTSSRPPDHDQHEFIVREQRLSNDSPRYQWWFFHLIYSRLRFLFSSRFQAFQLSLSSRKALAFCYRMPVCETVNASAMRAISARCVGNDWSANVTSPLLIVNNWVNINLYGALSLDNLY